MCSQWTAGGGAHQGKIRSSRSSTGNYTPDDSLDIFIVLSIFTNIPKALYTDSRGILPEFG